MTTIKNKKYQCIKFIFNDILVPVLSQRFYEQHTWVVGTFFKQGSIPVGCVPPACQLYVFQLPSLEFSTTRVRVGPQVNKFEQVPSDDHQMLAAKGGGRSHVSSDDHQMSIVGGRSGGRWVPYHVIYPMMHVTYLPPPVKTDACENITFPQLRLRLVIWGEEKLVSKWGDKCNFFFSPTPGWDK